MAISLAVLQWWVAVDVGAGAAGVGQIGGVGEVEEI